MIEFILGYAIISFAVFTVTRDRKTALQWVFPAIANVADMITEITNADKNEKEAD